MASFYLNDHNNWKQGDEIMLESFRDDSDQMLMKNNKLNTLISKNERKYIYVYDYLKLWTFFVEFFEVKEEEKDTIFSINIFSKGNFPEKAREKLFISN